MIPYVQALEISAFLRAKSFPLADLGPCGYNVWGSPKDMI